MAGPTMIFAARATVFGVLVALTCVTVGAAPAGGPWHYKGIRLGAKMSRDQIMAELGVTKYANNPELNPWKGCDKQAKGDCPFNRYGTKAGEWLEFNQGPYCEDSGLEGPGGFSCDNPWMASPSNHGITGVEVFGRADGTVVAIDIKFDSVVESEFFDVVHRQFEDAGRWVSLPGCAGPMTILGNISPQQKQPTEAPVLVNRVCETLTAKRFRAYMTNYDEIFRHVTPPIFRGVLELKLLDKEL